MSANNETSLGQSTSATSTPYSLTVANLVTHQSMTPAASLQDTPMQRWLAYTGDYPAQGCRSLGQGQQMTGNCEVKNAQGGKNR